MNKKSITGLNSLRFLCFLVIFINHATPYFHYGFLAVDFFFTLSGFLITYLALCEIEETSAVNRKNFFIRRVLRIWPLYFLVLVVSFFILPFVAQQYGTSITLPDKKLYYWFFICNYDFSQHHFALKQLWSIAVEEQFYIIFLFLSFFLKKYFWPVIVLLSSLYAFILFYSQSHSSVNLYSNTLYHLLSFAAGMVVAKIVANKSYPKIHLTTSGVVIFFLLTILFLNTAELSTYLKIPFSLFAASVILLIAQTQAVLTKNKAVFNITEQLGKYTYGLYIYSGFVIPFSVQLFNWQNKILIFITQLLLTITIAAFSYRFFESHFLRLKEKFRK